MSLSVCLVLHSEAASEMLVVCSKQKHGVMSARLADVKVFQHKHAGLPAVVTPSVKGAAESNLYSNSTSLYCKPTQLHKTTLLFSFCVFV